MARSMLIGPMSWCLKVLLTSCVLAKITIIFPPHWPYFPSTYINQLLPVLGLMQARANVTAVVEVSVSDLSKNRLNVTVLKDKLQILNDLLLDDDDARNTVSSKKWSNYDKPIIISLKWCLYNWLHNYALDSSTLSVYVLCSWLGLFCATSTVIYCQRWW